MLVQVHEAHETAPHLLRMHQRLSNWQQSNWQGQWMAGACHYHQRSCDVSAQISRWSPQIAGDVWTQARCKFEFFCLRRQIAGEEVWTRFRFDALLKSVHSRQQAAVGLTHCCCFQASTNALRWPPSPVAAASSFQAQCPYMCPYMCP